MALRPVVVLRGGKRYISPAAEERTGSSCSAGAGNNPRCHAEERTGSSCFSVETACGQVILSILQPMGRRWDRHTPLPPVAPRSA